jgi:hypothetical protein
MLCVVAACCVVLLVALCCFPAMRRGVPLTALNGVSTILSMINYGALRLRVWFVALLRDPQLQCVCEREPR